MAEKKMGLKELLEKGKHTGKVTTKELYDAMEESNFDVEKVISCMPCWSVKMWK